VIKPHARDYAERRKDFDITGETSPLDKNTSKDFSKKIFLPKNWFHRKKKTFAEGLTGGPRQSLTGNGRRD